MKEKTTWTKEKDIERKWHIVDVKGKILGRAATEIASLLIGKKKVNQVPNLDCGDYVIVLNSDHIKLTRGKGAKKTYFRHSGYPGGEKEITFDKQMLKNSTFVIEKAVTNMLPNSKLRSSMMTRLFVYKGTEHPHEAQKPEVFNL
jgi:large subunit ribosomal protein L13